MVNMGLVFVGITLLVLLLLLLASVYFLPQVLGEEDHGGEDEGGQGGHPS
ncbi:MAG: hypothetical protein V5A30_08395 [Haloarculaceae archaeon]